jgi:tetratricopeptide (TPR) repeat protein
MQHSDNYPLSSPSSSFSNMSPWTDFLETLTLAQKKFGEKEYEIAKSLYMDAANKTQYLDMFTEEAIQKYYLICINRIAESCIICENYEKAIKIASETLVIYPTNSRGLYLRGYAYVKLKNFESAYTDLSCSLKIDPTNTHVREQLMSAAISFYLDIIKKGENRSEILQELINLGVDPNFTYLNNTMTVLIYSSMIGCESNVHVLVSNGANVNAININGNTSLLHASKNRHVNIVKLLLCNGADRHYKLENGKTCFDITDSEEIKMLLENWEVTMVIIVLKELQVLSGIDASSFLDIPKYIG